MGMGEMNKNFYYISDYSMICCIFAKENKTNKTMETRTITVSVNVPKSYRIDLLQKQLTVYAQQLVASARPTTKSKQPYRHEALCGIFNSDRTEEQILEDYLQEKYNL